jgi:hypothetical protein
MARAAGDKMKLDEKPQLDEFSKRFAVELLARFPDLNQYFAAPEEFQKADNLSLEVRCPYPAELQWPLYIWTEGGAEVSIGLDACHTHFTCDVGQDESEIFAEALLFLDDIFEERIVVMSWVPPEGGFKGKIAGSSFNAPTQIEKEIADTSSGFIVRIRSWKGTFSRDHKT